MAYVKTEWVAETAVTYALLNHIEEQYDEITDYLAAHDHDDRYYTKAEVDSYFWDGSTDGEGSTLDADTLEGIEEAAIVSGAEVGIGGWYCGSMDDFTDGYLDADPTWHVCDGDGGSIDLQDVMIIGAGGEFAAGQTGGNNTFKPAGLTYGESHILTAAECMHTHLISDLYGANMLRGGSGQSGAMTSTTTSVENETNTAGGGIGHEHTGTFTCSTTYNQLPPFIALIPIQKVS
jgi:hypothetical protein